MELTHWNRFDTPLKFPLLDSFPSIYREGAGQNEISVQTVLSTETTIGSQVKTLKSLTARSISFDEREALSNSLAEIADAYQDDWSSGSDEDDDDL